AGGLGVLDDDGVAAELPALRGAVGPPGEAREPPLVLLRPGEPHGHRRPPRGEAPDGPAAGRGLPEAEADVARLAGLRSPLEQVPGVGVEVVRDRLVAGPEVGASRVLLGDV